MTVAERLRRLADALPEGASVTLGRDALLRLVDGVDEEPSLPVDRDLTVEQVAAEVRRAPSTTRAWLINGTLDGFKLNGRDWRVPQGSLRRFLDAQREPQEEAGSGEVDIGAWRLLRQRRKR